MDPGMDLVGDLGKNEQIVPAKGIAVFPFRAILVQAAEGRVETGDPLGFILPDRALYPS